MIFAVAGSGKTTFIVESLVKEKRSLIVTYTNSNYDNLSQKILKNFNGVWPETITLMTYFQFLYRFCYKPFLSDRVKARGIIYERNPDPRPTQQDKNYYISPGGYFYSNRLSLFLEKAKTIEDIRSRIETYFDEFIIDEIQDIAGRDFHLLEALMSTNVNMLFVGDFYQHTFDTSRDGNVNQSLFDDKATYEARFTSKGFSSDSTTLVNSWRCGKNICQFITRNLGINISSNRIEEDGKPNICYVTDPVKLAAILDNSMIVKLHYQKCYTFGPGHRNWGDTKGEDNHEDICVMLNKTTAKLYKQGKLCNLAPSTRNKLYVAITRAHGDVYLVNE